jgi:hypothetical protein
MGWNNGTNSNQLYRPEASRLLTGAPADTSLWPASTTALAWTTLSLMASILTTKTHHPPYLTTFSKSTAIAKTTATATTTITLAKPHPTSALPSLQTISPTRTRMRTTIASNNRLQQRRADIWNMNITWSTNIARAHQERQSQTPSALLLVSQATVLLHFANTT